MIAWRNVPVDGKFLEHTFMVFQTTYTYGKHQIAGDRVHRQPFNTLVILAETKLFAFPTDIRACRHH